MGSCPLISEPLTLKGDYVLLNRLYKALEAGPHFLLKCSNVLAHLEILYSANSEQNSIFSNYLNIP